MLVTEEEGSMALRRRTPFYHVVCLTAVFIGLVTLLLALAP